MKPVYIIFITGFMRPHFGDGFVRMAQETAMIPGVQAGLYHWYDHDKIVADMNKHCDKTIIIVGHSYGVSTGLFAAETAYRKKCIKVEHFIGVDGVYRPSPYRPSLRSLKRGAILWVPGSVEKLYVFRQERGLIIQGSQYDYGPKTEIKLNVVVEDTRHPGMERLPQVEELIHELLEQ